MTPTEFSSLSGRDLDASVARAIGWTRIITPVNRDAMELPMHCGHTGIPPGETRIASIPVFSAADGPLSQMLAYLDAKKYLLECSYQNGEWIVIPSKMVNVPGPNGTWRRWLMEGIGKSINEAVARCVLIVANEEAKEQP